MSQLQWNDNDIKAIAISRALAMDAVQKVGNGHPGTAMALAPCAYLLFQKHLRHDPKNPDWFARDRFVLSIGHSSLTLYIQLFLSGYDISLEDLKAFRTKGSKTPGHPEFGHTVGVETTTGPLGQGVANAVGMAMAIKRIQDTVNNPKFSSLYDPFVYVLAGDGCLQEGVSAEASSLAGHLGLDNLIVIYDSNNISIDGDTNLAFTEDVLARYASYGFNVFDVPRLEDGDIDVRALHTALLQAKNRNGKPSFIRMQSTIAWPAPNARNTAKSHGSAIGADEISKTKTLLGLDPELDFYTEPAVLAHTQKSVDRGAAFYNVWQQQFHEFEQSEPESRQILKSLLSIDVDSLTFPAWEKGEKVSTRKASGKTLNSIAKNNLGLWGGSADLSESNSTFIEGGGAVSKENFSNANIHFGIREHAMGAIANGLALSGLRPYVATFLVFSDYMRPAVRLSSLMNLPVVYVWTHDSIGLGEDGPTHQPVEHLSALRLIPNFSVARPADANETAVVWKTALKKSSPIGISLSRQDLPVVTDREAALQAEKGAYILVDEPGYQVTLIATGSEVSLALDAQSRLLEIGIHVRVVSMPCVEWFRSEPIAYQNEVLGSKPRIAIEAGSPDLWLSICDAAIGVEDFGESAEPNQLMKDRGLNVENIMNRVQEFLP
ncbi:MAG: transketolase [Candidatus Nanopelagicales bacterium]